MDTVVGCCCVYGVAMSLEVVDQDQDHTQEDMPTVYTRSDVQESSYSWTLSTTLPMGWYTISWHRASMPLDRIPGSVLWDGMQYPRCREQYEVTIAILEMPSYLLSASQCSWP